MAEIRVYKENYFARRKKIFFILSLALLAVTAIALAAGYFYSRRDGRDPYAGKVVRISDGSEDIGRVKNFQPGKSISYYSAGSGFHDLVYHRFRGEYSIQVLAGDAAAYLDKKKREAEAAAAQRTNAFPAPAPSALPPEVRIVSGDEASHAGVIGPDDGPALGEMPAAAPAAGRDEEEAPGYALTREEGIRDYESEVSALAVKADRIDALWQKHREFCQGTIAVSVGNAFGRQWFGIYTTINAADTPECRMMVQDMKTLAADIDDGMEAAWEKAHRAGVYPGQMRAVQQKYRMELDRWNR
jgi:hypothetical protein